MLGWLLHGHGAEGWQTADYARRPTRAGLKTAERYVGAVVVGSWEAVGVRRDPAGPGSRGGNWRSDTVEDVREYVAGFPEVFGGIRVEGDLVVVAFTADLDEHRRGLQASVEHPEMVRVERAGFSEAKLTADIQAIRRRLANDPRRPEQGGGPGFIRLRAPLAELAAELHEEYGDALEITVGRKPFPPEKIGRREPVPVPVPTVVVPGLRLTVVLDEPTVAAGEDVHGRVVFVNEGTDLVEGMTGVLTGGVCRHGDDFMAGAFTGAVVAIGYTVRLEPGQRKELGLIVGTASCLPDTSYVVSPGPYEAIATVPFRQADTAPGDHPRLVARGARITVAPG